MLARLQAPADTPVALETGTQCAWVHRVMQAQGMAPVVVEAGEVRAKARRRAQKNDERDAFELCDGLRRGIFARIVWIPGLSISRLRELLRRRAHFVRLSTSQINAAKFLLRTRGLPTARVELRSARGWRALAASEALDPEARLCVTLHEQVWLLARSIIEQLEALLKEALKPFAEEIELLQTVPGVGPITAAAFIAAVGDPSRFATSGHVASYLGLVPSSHSSGDSERGGRITKEGNGALRALLCECAHQARRTAHPLNPYHRKLSAQKGSMRATVAVAHRLARILYQVWKKREPFDEAKLGVVRETRVTRRTTHYQLAAASA